MLTVPNYGRNQSFHAYVDKKNRIILEPYAEIPARELWIHKNKKQLNSVEKGLNQSVQGKVKIFRQFFKTS